MRIILAFVLALLVTACGQARPDPYAHLKGRWIGGKAMLFAQIRGPEGIIVFTNQETVPIRIEIEPSGHVSITETLSAESLWANFVPPPVARQIKAWGGVPPSSYYFVYRAAGAYGPELSGFKSAWLVHFRETDNSLVRVETNFRRPETWFRITDKP